MTTNTTVDSQMQCKTLAGNRLYFGLASGFNGELREVDITVQIANSTMLDISLSQFCSTAMHDVYNSRYIYFFAGTTVIRMERWDMFGVPVKSFTYLQYALEMSTSSISFIDSANNMLFFISPMGVIKAIDISQYYEPMFYWIGVFSVLGISLLFLVVITLCCMSMYRKVRKQRRIEEELRGLLTENIQSYGSNSSTSSVAWIIPPEDLTITQRIASGAFGQVFKGKYKDTPVAIKVCFVIFIASHFQKLKVEDSDMFQQEVGLLNTLRHPNIVLFIGVCSSGEYQLIVTEYLENGSLDSFLRSIHGTLHSAFTFNKKLEILMDVVKGMQYLHSMGLIHRDVKTSNILVSFFCVELLNHLA
jgi:hypothetical protein